MSDYPLSPPRTRSSLPAADISGFFDAVNEALRLHLQTEKWPDGTKPKFVHDFPRERLAKADEDFDVITHHVVGSQMSPTTNDGRVPKSPMVLDPVQSQMRFGYNERTVLWMETVAVSFDIWSRSNASADLITNWFHRFMMKYGWGLQFFRARGIEQFCFIERREDQVEKVREGQEVYQRSLVYEFRIQYLQTLLEKQFDSVSVTVGVDRQTDTIQRP